MTQGVDGKQPWLLMVFHQAISKQRKIMCTQISTQTIWKYGFFIPIFALNMIRYNILASIKRTLDYDTIGGLFGDMYLGVHELTVVEKIWAIIIEVVAVVSELIDADSDELIIKIIENDKRLDALREYAQTA